MKMAEAARRLGVTRQRIYQLVERYRLPIHRLPRNHLMKFPPLCIVCLRRLKQRLTSNSRRGAGYTHRTCRLPPVMLMRACITCQRPIMTNPRDPLNRMRSKRYRRFFPLFHRRCGMPPRQWPCTICKTPVLLIPSQRYSLRIGLGKYVICPKLSCRQRWSTHNLPQIRQATMSHERH